MPNKNVLAILSGVVALGLAALAVAMNGDALPVLGSTGAALGLVAWGVTNASRRNALMLMVLAAGSGALFFHFDSFWGLVVCGLVLVWSAVGLLPIMDGVWRLKLGFIAAVFFGAFIALWPTLHNMSGGRIPLPRYIADRVTFAMAPGLDIRGGVRLVYTVEVEEAIRDKRDHYADDMRQELATSFGFHSGEGRVTPSRTRRTSRSSTTASTRPSWASSRRPRASSPPRSPTRFARTWSRRPATAPSPRRRTRSTAASTRWA
jgi:hypothetical protein